MRSDLMKSGVDRIPHRALFRALGLTDEELSRPIIGVAEGIYNQFKNALDATVTTVVTSFTEQTSTDFSAQIEQLKDCKFIFMPIYYTPAQLFMIQAKDKIAPDAIYYGCDGLDGVASENFFVDNVIPQEVSMLSHFDSNAQSGPAKTLLQSASDPDREPWGSTPRPRPVPRGRQLQL